MKYKSLFVLILVIIFTSCSNLHWIKYSKDKVTIYIPENNKKYSYYPDEKIIRNELIHQNYVINEISRRYIISFKGKIRIFLYPKEIAQKYIGTVNGGGYNYITNKIKYVLAEPCFSPVWQENSLVGEHETVHALFMNFYGISNSNLMVEGAAVAIDKCFGIVFNNGKWIRNSIYDIVRDQRDQKKLLSIKYLCSGKGDDQLFYPQSGIFIEWLINNYGIMKYQDLYLNTNKKILTKTQNYFGLSLEELEEKYRNYLLEL